jgi:hypothetical protein
MATSTSTVKIRRMDPVPFVMMGILVLGTISVLVVNGAHPLVPAGVFGCVVLMIGVFAYLDGPAAYLAAGPARVVVGNSYVRYDVPRGRLVSTSTMELLGLYLVLDDGSKIRLRVFDPAMRGSTYRSPGRSMAAANRILDVLRSAPVTDDGGRVTRHIRWLSVGLTALPFVLLATLIVAARR